MTRLQPQPAPDAQETRLPPPLPREDPITRLPILILFPHSRCNCRCLMCDIWRATTSSELAAADVARWLEEWRGLGLKRIVLSGGEALMHSHLWELCDHLHAAGIGITILSTGLLLRRHAANLVRYCDDVVVSLDGPQPIHNQIRNIPRAYEKLAEGVAAVKAADTRVIVSGRCTVQQSNFGHLRATVAAAHTLGLDRISFLAADVSSEAFNRPGGWDDERTQQVALAPDELPLLAAEIDALERECAADFASGYIAEPALKLRRRLHQYYAALLGQADFYPNDCNAPWVSTVIESDGTVRPCFFQPPLGNIYQAGSLVALLNSPEAIAWRQGLDTRRDAICRKCVCTLSLRDERPTTNDQRPIVEPKIHFSRPQSAILNHEGHEGHEGHEEVR
jgi:Fe-coproporphyrin III synthase